MLFGDPNDVRRAGAPGPVNGVPTEGPVAGSEAGPSAGMPQGVPPGQGVQPDPSQMALANQVYQLQQMVTMQQQQLAEMRNRKLNVRIDLVKDRDGKTVGMVATEGME